MDLSPEERKRRADVIAARNRDPEFRARQMAGKERRAGRVPDLDLEELSDDDLAREYLRMYRDPKATPATKVKALDAYRELRAKREKAEAKAGPQLSEEQREEMLKSIRSLIDTRKPPARAPEPEDVEVLSEPISRSRKEPPAEEPEPEITPEEVAEVKRDLAAEQQENPSARPAASEPWPAPVRTILHDRDGVSVELVTKRDHAAIFGEDRRETHPYFDLGPRPY